MGDISRVALFGKLNSLAYKSIESATVFCKLRGNPYVELVHWVHQILQQQSSDLHLIVRAFGIDAGRLARMRRCMIARKMRVKRPGVRVREARLRPGGFRLACAFAQSVARGTCVAHRFPREPLVARRARKRAMAPFG